MVECRRMLWNAAECCFCFFNFKNLLGGKIFITVAKLKKSTAGATINHVGLQQNHPRFTNDFLRYDMMMNGKGLGGTL